MLGEVAVHIQHPRIGVTEETDATAVQRLFCADGAEPVFDFSPRRDGRRVLVGDFVGSAPSGCCDRPRRPVTTWKSTAHRAKALEISGMQQAWQLASHSPVPVCA